MVRAKPSQIFNKKKEMRNVVITAKEAVFAVTTMISLLTIAEVSEILKVHRSTVSRQISSGKLTYIDLGSKKLIEESDLLQFIENRRNLEAISPKGE